MTQLTRRRALLVAAFALAALALSACAGGRASLQLGSWPGIALNGDVAYVAFETSVSAIDLASCEVGDCQELWRYSALANRGGLIGGRPPVQFYAPPAFEDEVVVVGDYSETLHALDAETGRDLWTYTTDRARFIGGATVAEGSIYAGASDGLLYAFDASDGDVLWTFEAGSDIWDAPAFDEGVLYVPTLGHTLYAVDARSGSELWRFEAEGALVSAPTLHEGRLYFGAFDNTVYALDAETGRLVWTHDMGQWVWGSPAVAGADVLVVGDLGGKVSGLDAEDGRPIWEYETGGPVVATPLILDGTAYVGSEDANVYALDVETGRERWQQPIRTEVTNNFLVIQTGTSIKDVPLYAPLRSIEREEEGEDQLLLVGLQLGDDLLLSVEADTGNGRWLFAPEGGGSAPVASTGQDGEEEPEELTPIQQVVRLLPLAISMMLFTILLMRRRQQSG